MFDFIGIIIGVILLLIVLPLLIGLGIAMFLGLTGLGYLLILFSPLIVLWIILGVILF